MYFDDGTEVGGVGEGAGGVLRVVSREWRAVRGVAVDVEMREVVGCTACAEVDGAAAVTGLVPALKLALRALGGSKNAPIELNADRCFLDCVGGWMEGPG